MKQLLTAVAALSFCLTAQAQAEYGDASELKGVRKIFVDTGTDLEVRENILKEIAKSKKKLPGLEVVSRAEDAEVILAFGSSSDARLAGISTEAPAGSTTATSSAVYRTVTRGEGLVFKPLEGGRIRLLMSFKDSRSSRFERRPSTNFAREFVRAYAKANDPRR